MFAALVYNLCHGPDTTLRVYKDEATFKDDPDHYIESFALTNGQLTEFVVVQGIQPVDLNA